MATAHLTEIVGGSLSDPPRPLRSAGAVAAGLVAVIVLSSAVDAVLHTTGIYPPNGQPMASGLYLLATAYRCAFQIAGGYLTARIAPHRPMKHVIVLGFVGLALAALGVLASWNAGPEFGPRWYPLALVALALPTVWAGGSLHARHMAEGST
jgi:hypothetical protein